MEKTVVDMISLCSADGQVYPLRFRVENDIGELIRVNIDEIIDRKEIPYIGVESYTYLCRASAQQHRFVVELKYYIRSHTWYVLSQYVPISTMW